MICKVLCGVRCFEALSFLNSTAEGVVAKAAGKMQGGHWAGHPLSPEYTWGVDLDEGKAV